MAMRLAPKLALFLKLGRAIDALNRPAAENVGNHMTNLVCHHAQIRLIKRLLAHLNAGARWGKTKVTWDNGVGRRASPHDLTKQSNMKSKEHKFTTIWTTHSMCTPPRRNPARGTGRQSVVGTLLKFIKGFSVGHLAVPWAHGKRRQLLPRGRDLGSDARLSTHRWLMPCQKACYQCPRWNNHGCRNMGTGVGFWLLHMDITLHLTKHQNVKKKSHCLPTPTQQNPNQLQRHLSNTNWHKAKVARQLVKSTDHCPQRVQNVQQNGCEEQLDIENNECSSGSQQCSIICKQNLKFMDSRPLTRKTKHQPHTDKTWFNCKSHFKHTKPTSNMNSTMCVAHLIETMSKIQWMTNTKLHPKKQRNQCTQFNNKRNETISTNTTFIQHTALQRMHFFK